MMWINEVSAEDSHRATRILARALAMPKVKATWAKAPTMLAVFIEASPEPNVLIGGPAGIHAQLAARLPASLVARVVADLHVLWESPSREANMTALVMWTTPAERLVALQVHPAVLGIRLDVPAKVGPVPEGATMDERRRWLRKHGEIAIQRVGAANMRAATAKDEVVIVAVEANGEIGYAYESRSEHAEDFPEPVKLRPGETAACHGLLVDLDAPGEDKPYERFRMVAMANMSAMSGRRGAVD